MVLFQPAGPEVPDRVEDEPGDGSGLLEGNREGPGNLQLENVRACWNEENPSFLPGKGSKGREEQLGDARVPP